MSNKLLRGLTQAKSRGDRSRPWVPFYVSGPLVQGERVSTKIKEALSPTEKIEDLGGKKNPAVAIVKTAAHTRRLHGRKGERLSFNPSENDSQGKPCGGKLT